MKALFVALAVLLLGARVAAETKPRPWAVTARTTYAILGPTERQTGGMMVTGESSRSWKIGEESTVAVGAALALSVDVARWMAILGGPTVAVRTRAWGPLGVGAILHLDAGRLPTCNRWGLCMLYSGLFPALTASARWSPSELVSVEITGGARVIRTLAWSGAGGEGGLAASFRF